MRVSGINPGLIKLSANPKAEAQDSINNTNNSGITKTLAQPANALLKLYFAGNVRPKEFASLDFQVNNFRKWADKLIMDASSGRLPHKLAVPEASLASAPTLEEVTRNKKTVDLYKKHFDTFFWTGEECSDAIFKDEKTGKEERWDQLELINLYDKKVRQEHIDELKKLHIKNMRFGVPQHLLNSIGKDWKNFDKKVGQALRDFSNAGVKISLDLQHFGLPDKFGNSKDPSKSYFLNKDWPAYHARVAKKVIENYSDNISAVTLVNEPYVTNLFSSGMLNEKFPGWGGRPDFDHFAINRAVLMAEAAVRAKMEIEKFVQKQPDPDKARKVYVHNEAVDNKADNEFSNKYFRFMNSDLILGQDWLMKGDFKKSDMFKWMAERYVRPEFKDSHGNPVTDENKIRKLQHHDYDKLVDQLTRLRDLHLKLKEETGKTMMDDTVFGIDYYTTNESGISQGEPLSDKARDYIDEVESGRRKGVYGVTKEYWDRYHLPVLHTETNYPDENGDNVLWGRQQLAELRQLDKSGIPVLGANWYSLADQYAWLKFLNVSPKEVKENPEKYHETQGLMNPVKNKQGIYEKRAVARELLPDLISALEGN